MMAMLKQQYPARLMPQLVQSSQATLQVTTLPLYAYQIPCTYPSIAHAMQSTGHAHTETMGM